MTQWNVLLLFPAAFLVLRVLNYRRKNRYRQALFPLTATVYAIAVSVFATNILPEIQRLTSYIPSQIYYSLGMDFILFFLSNLLTIILFIALKAFLRIVFHKRKGVPVSAPTLLRKRYYDFDNQNPCLNPHGMNVHTYFSVLTSCVSFVLILYLALYCFAPTLLPFVIPWEHLTFWPILFLIVGKEWEWYLDGPHSCDEDKTRTSSAARNREKYYEIDFADWLSAKRQLDIKPSKAEADNQHIYIASMVESGLQKLGSHCDFRILNCVDRICEGTGVLVDCVLLSYLGNAILLYLDILLSRGENFLVMCADDMIAEQTAEHLRKVWSNLHGGTPIWIVRSPQEASKSGDCDVLVLTPQEVLSLKTGMEEDPFSDGLKNLLVLDTSDILAQQAPLFSTAVRMLNAAYPNLKTIFLCNGIPLQLPSTLEYIMGLPSGTLKVVNPEYDARNLSVYLWNTENKRGYAIPQEQLIKKRMDNVNLGFSFSLAVDIEREKETPVIFNAKSTPLQQIRRTAGDAPALRELLGGEKKLEAFFQDLSSLQMNTCSVVWEDENFNLPSAVHKASAYASDTATLHIISRSYFLRDFFADRFASESNNLLSDRNYFNSLSSLLTETAYTAAIHILIEASARDGIDQARVCSIAAPFFATDQLNIRNILSWCRNLALGYEVNYPLEYDFTIKAETLFIQNNFEQSTRIYLINQRLLSGLSQGQLKRAVLEIESPMGITQHMLWFSANSIEQRCLLYQGFQYNNVLYSIYKTDLKNGIICARQAEESLKTAPDYVQTRLYNLSGKWQSDSLIIGTGNINIEDPLIRVQEYAGTELEVYTRGYFAILPDYATPMIFNRSMPYYRLDNSYQPRTLTSPHAAVLSIYCNSTESDRIACLLSALLNELFRTFFPYDWQCISACPLLSAKAEKDASFMADWELVRKYYPSLASTPEEWYSSHYISVAIIEDQQQAGNHHIQALLGDPQRPFEKPLSVLHDYLCWLTDHPDSQRYLYLGKESMPDCFRLDLLCETLKQLNDYVIR